MPMAFRKTGGPPADASNAAVLCAAELAFRNILEKAGCHCIQWAAMLWDYAAPAVALDIVPAQQTACRLIRGIVDQSAVCIVQVIASQPSIGVYCESIKALFQTCAGIWT